MPNTFPGHDVPYVLQAQRRKDAKAQRKTIPLHFFFFASSRLRVFAIPGAARIWSGPGIAIISLIFSLFAGSSQGAPVEDPYEQYVKTSKDFRPVRQDKAWLLKAFPSWTYMPWTYRWTIGYNDAAGKWSVEHGYNGAFIDWGQVDAEGSKTGRIDWIDRFKLHFYMDHVAGKRYLHMWDSAEMKRHYNELHSNGVRARPVNAALIETVRGYIRKNINAVKMSPYRSAYALDDETSWGHFVHPAMWCVTDDQTAYPNWLAEIYGTAAPKRNKWFTYNDILPKLGSWTIADFDASPLMDQWTFNDSYWNNFIGDLVEYANEIDPATPVGWVGGQAPNAFGGYDYAKVMRKVQFIESYNLGSSQAIIRSFNPHNAIPAVTTHFHRNVAESIHQTWYYLAHGNRGFIGWVDKWFDGKTPEPWHEQVAPTFLEAANKVGPLMSGAEWIHDGVAIYYSHPSIQLGWILDAEAHHKSWTNRNNDYRVGSSHHVRQAWQNMLRDEGLQFNFLSYADVVQHGVPGEYRVLILPGSLCLSDAEARQIKAFCDGGGTVIADYLPGLWDQHGKGRPAGGALDDVFGVRHDPKISAKDVFGGNLWCEVDQDTNFSWKTYDDFLGNKNACIKDATGFNKAVRDMPVIHTNHFGKGTAVLLNLSPQWYNAYRMAGATAAARRAVFMDPIRAAGVKPWVSLDGEKAFGREITYWNKGDRTIVFVVFNPETVAALTGTDNPVGLKSETIPVTLRFARPVNDARDERTGKQLGTGNSFRFDWKMDEAIVISFAAREK